MEVRTLPSRMRAAPIAWGALLARIDRAAARRPVRVAAAASAHLAVLLVVAAVSLGRLVSTPPDPDLVRRAVARAEAALGSRYDVAIQDAAWTLEGGTLGLALDGVRFDPRAEGPGLRLRRAVATLGLGGSLRALHLDGAEPALPPPRPGPIDLRPVERLLTDGLAPALDRLAALGLERLDVTNIRPPRGRGTGPHRRLNAPVAYPE